MVLFLALVRVWPRPTITYAHTLSVSLSSVQAPIWVKYGRTASTVGSADGELGGTGKGMNMYYDGDYDNDKYV